MAWENLSELQEYDEVTNSYTNQVYETDGSFVKVFDQVSSTTVARAVKTALKGEFDWVSAEERSVKERNAGQILEPYGIPVPEVIDYGTLDGGKHYVELDSIEGPDAFSFLYNDADAEQAEKFGRIEGHRLNSLHQDGISPVDSGWANRIVTDNNVWWIDNEFLTTEATAAEMQGDLEKFYRAALRLPEEKFDAVTEGFEQSYGDSFSERDTVEATIYDTVVGGLLNPREETANTLRNASFELFPQEEDGEELEIPEHEDALEVLEKA